MPPLPYLKRMPGLDCKALPECYADASVWDAFDPALVTLCSPDPQTFRPPGRGSNVLQKDFQEASIDQIVDTVDFRLAQYRLREAS